MAIAASNPFSVRIRVPSTSSMPTVQDEKDTYTSWGWTWTEGTANPTFNSDTGPASISFDSTGLHNDTEGDDLWANLQAYNRRASGNAGYLERVQKWASYYKNTLLASNEWADEISANRGYDHVYGWGIQEYADLNNDAAAAAIAIAITDELHSGQAHAWSTRISGGWPVAGVYPMCAFGGRYGGRNLKTAVAVADATGNANAVELRNRLIDLWTNSPDWDETKSGSPAAGGMYWMGSEQLGFAGLTAAPYNMVYANGDRAISTFHIGIITDALIAAWQSPTVTQTRKTAIRDKLIKMALFIRTYGLDPTHLYAGAYIGIHGSTKVAWHNYSSEFQTVTSWDQVYTAALVNLLVMGYKFTGDRDYLDGTAVTTWPGIYPAKYVLNRYSKAQWGHPTNRAFGDTVVGHFQDTELDSSSERKFFGWNKGEFQYTYLIFENGGAPTVF